MRKLVEPPPSLHCEHCRGELQLKCIVPDDPTLDLERYPNGLNRLGDSRIS